MTWKCIVMLVTLLASGIRSQSEIVGSPGNDFCVCSPTVNCADNADDALNSREMWEKMGITIANALSRANGIGTRNQNGSSTTVSHSELKSLVDQQSSLMVQMQSTIASQAGQLLKLQEKLSYLEDTLKVTSRNLIYVQEQNLHIQARLRSLQVINVSVEAIGYEDNHRSGCTKYCGYTPLIRINGVTVHRANRRSYNFLVLNASDGQEIQFAQFDVYGNSSNDQAVWRFYQSIPNHSVVILGTYDEPKRHANKTLDVIEALGVTRPSFSTGREAFAMIGYKGSYKPSWVTSRHVRKRQGLAVAKTLIPLMLA